MKDISRCKREILWFIFVPILLTKIKLIDKIQEIKPFLKYLSLKIITETCKNSM